MKVKSEIYRKPLLAAGVVSLGVLCFAVYGEALGYYFTSMDAFPLLLTGRIDSLEDIGRIFSSPLGGGFPFGTYYRPLSELSYGIDYLIWGKDPMGYHLTDILLHLVNSIMVFFIAGLLYKGIKKGLLFAWIASLLFLLHPLGSAVVPSIARRQDMLIALLLSLCLLSFVKAERSERNRTAWYALSLMIGFLAVFSKESAFVLPVLIGLLSFIFNDGCDYGKRLITAVRRSMPFFGLAALNTLLHVYLFGSWGVHGSSGPAQNAAAAVKSFFMLAGPLEILHLSAPLRAATPAVIFLTAFLFLANALRRHGVRGFLNEILSRERKVYTYLTAFILTFMALFTISGKSLDFYHYLPNMAVIILAVMALADTFRKKWASVVVKFSGGIFTAYAFLYSPVFADYDAWRSSSELTRRTIEETETALLSDRDASRIYLINWPGFIGLESEAPGTNSTILVSYSMDAWAEWAGLKPSRNVEFIHVSYASFPAGDISAKLNYVFKDREIHASAEGCLISPSKFPYKGEVPFKLRIDDDMTSGTLVFTRELQDNERLFLYDVNGIRIVRKAVYG
ncbi:MAG: hypothetical protein C4526_05990 [Nitrospiraceae bacterium]|nr:MAG: hypothetical protein C4526_05990 [Nitrospiraceae bacterium]